MGGLPSSYATIVTALETKIDNLTLQFVKQALINEEQKRVNGNDNSSGATTSGGASAMMSNSGEMCRITPGQWEQKVQARGNVTNVAKKVI